MMGLRLDLVGGGDADAAALEALGHRVRHRGAVEADLAGPPPDVIAVMAGRRRAPGRVLRGPVHDGVPVCLLHGSPPPGTEAAGGRVPIAVGAMWKRHYLGEAQRFAARLGLSPDACWTADRLDAGDLAGRLAGGVGLFAYFGHGRPGAWCGYRGVSAADLAGARIGTVLSFSCAGMALAPGTPFSLGSNLVRTGAAGCVFGAIGPVSLRPMHDLIDVAAWAITATAGRPIAAAFARMHEAIATGGDPALSQLWGMHRIVGLPSTPT